jgi:signal transduction histidine kinase
VTGRLHSVRFRSTLGAFVVVLVALVAASVILVGILKATQLRTIDNALELRAIDIESLLDGGAAPATVTVESEEDGFVQIVDARGDIIAASANVVGQAPLATTADATTRSRRIDVLGGEQFRIYQRHTDGAIRATIVVGTTLENATELEHVVVATLAVGVPVLLILIAAMVWFVVARALRPVEAIRSEVADIGGRQLNRRVPAPPSDDEIGRLAATMNEMLDRLERAHHKQTEFVSNASHELRTPIAIIRHELEVALRADDADSLRDAARDVLDEDLRMQRLVDDLLFMARHEGPSAPADLSNQPAIDLDDLVLTEVGHHRSDASIDISGVSAGQVRGNEDHLRRVVRNLLENALRHAVSAVAIHVTSANGDVTLEIDDDGPGVAAPYRDRIFERFVRGDEARARDDGGSGLGLAIVDEIVRGHGGTVSVHRSPWLGGARFTVTLPDARR